MNHRKGEIFVLLSASGFGIMPILGKFAYGAGADINQVLLYRFTLASILLWGYVLITRKEFKIGKECIMFLAVLGIAGYDTTAIAQFTSFKYISAGLADLLLFLYPPMIAVVQVLLFKKSISKTAIIALILSMAGIGLIVWTPNMSYDARGITAGVLSAVFYCFYVLSLDSEKIRHIDSIVITTYVVTFCALGILAYSVLLHGFTISVPPASLFYIFLIAVLSTVMPILLFCIGVKSIGPSNSSILGTFEPVVATFAGAAFFKEAISIYTIGGGILVIAGVVLLQMDKKTVHSKANEYMNGADNFFEG